MYWIVQEWSLRTGGLCVEVVFRTGSTVVTVRRGYHSLELDDWTLTMALKIFCKFAPISHAIPKGH